MKKRWILFLLFVLSFCVSIFLFLNIFKIFWECSKNVENLIVSFTEKYLNTSSSRQNQEHCLNCHQIETKFISFHNPKVIGCSSCHLGNPNSDIKEIAHKGISSTPGNLSIVSNTCGKAGCHSEIAERVNKSLMNTMTGIVSVDKFVFDEIQHPEGFFDIMQIKNSPADVHLRNLCASCHLGKEKTEISTITTLSRGGGCSACHLHYDSLATTEVEKYKQKRNFAPKYHPEISLKVTSVACFGCHSRSGRISTNFVGLMETNLEVIPNTNNQNFVQLEDGRIFVREQPDVHNQKGMECIDCHTAKEIMGDGLSHQHKEQQIQISCVDCHPRDSIRSSNFEKLDPESKKIIFLRKWNHLYNSNFVGSKENSSNFYNVIVRNDSIFVLQKGGKKIWFSPKPNKICREQQKLHPSLECKTCHTRWVPRCISCHTTYNPEIQAWDNLLDRETKGGWQEIGGNFSATLPTLGNVQNGKEYKVSTFMPGMILLIDGKKFPNKSFFKHTRLFAPTFSHTISKQTPTCKECHFNPLVLGFGSGKLLLTKESGKHLLKFIPSSETSPFDKLPEDAWIGFRHNKQGNSTRKYAYSLLPQQIKRIIEVGVCFECHNWNMEKTLDLFTKNYKKKISSKCIVPKF